MRPLANELSKSLISKDFEYVNELNKRLSAQKGVKVEFDSILDANHFFSKNETGLTKSLNSYIKKETALY